MGMISDNNCVVVSSGETYTIPNGSTYTFYSDPSAFFVKNGGRLVTSAEAFSGTKAVFDNGEGDEGAAVRVEGVAELDQVLFSGNGAGQGGAVCNSGTFTATDVTFSGNNADLVTCTIPLHYGGAVYNSGIFTATSNTFSGNYAGIYGGAVYNSGTFAATGSTFSGNSTRNGSGGAVYNSGAFTATDVTFSGNSVYFVSYSGGTIMPKYGGAVFNEGDFTATGSTFSGNVAEDAGGAVYNRKLDWYGNDAFTASSVTFIGNTADDDGGAVYNEGDFIAMGCTFRGNSAGLCGGAVYHEGDYFTAVGSTFSGNSAFDGGAVFNAGDYFTAVGSTFSGNSAGENGGAVYNGNGSVTLRDCVFATEIDTIYNNGGSLTLGGTIWTAANLCSNIAITVEADTELVLDLSGHAGSMTKELLTNFDTMFGQSQENLTITINVMQDQATGTYVLATGAADFDKTITIQCGEQPGAQLGIGETVMLNGNRYSLQLENNSLCIDSTLLETGIVTPEGEATELVINGVPYIGRSYRTDELETALSEKTTIAMAGGEVSSRTSSLTVDVSQTLVSSEVLFSGNSAEEYGGAVDNHGTFTATSVSFSGNSAIQGGAVDNHGAFSATCGTFSNNSASLYGGAVDNDGTFSAESVRFSGNSARQGGAVYNLNDGIFTATSVSFSSNSAGQDGGAVHNKGAFTAVDVTFSSNTASFGGAVTNWGTFTAMGSTFSGNSAERHGTVYNTKKMILRDSVFATENDTIYNDGGSLTLGGTIWTAANIFSDVAVTVEKDTELVLDISVYAGTTTRELLTNFNAMFGQSQEDLAITVNVAQNQEEGTYVLATGVSSFGKAIIVQCGEQTSAQLEIGESVVLNGNIYSLQLGNNSLCIDCDLFRTGIVTHEGNETELVISEVTYSGTAYRTDELETALSENDLTAMAGTRVTIKHHEVAEDRTLVSANSLLGWNVTHKMGGAVYNWGTFTVMDCTFVYNEAKKSEGAAEGDGVGGAVANSRAFTVTGGTFSDNYAERSGGAVYNKGTFTAIGVNFVGNTAGDYGGAVNNQGTFTATDVTFNGNTAGSVVGSTFKDGGAVFNNRIFTATGVDFIGNTAALYGGAVYNSGTFTATGSTFSGNTANNGGALYNHKNKTATLRDCVFATETDTIYNDGGSLTLGGSIRTAANIWSANAITVEADTELVLDISVYAGTTTRELLTNFDTLFGQSQENLTITVNVAQNQAEGTYLLATGASSLAQESFSVSGVTVGVNGDRVMDTDRKQGYTLTKNEVGNLYLTVDHGVDVFYNPNWTVGSEVAFSFRGKEYHGTAGGSGFYNDRATAIEQAGTEGTVIAVGGGTVSGSEIFKGANVLIAPDGNADYLAMVICGSNIGNGTNTYTLKDIAYDVTVDGGHFDKTFIVGDAMASSVGNNENDCFIERTTTLTTRISGGVFDNRFVGGSYYGVAGEHEAKTNTLLSVGGIELTVSGGSFGVADAKRFYAGNSVIKEEYSDNTKVDGNIRFTLDADSAPIAFGEHVICGSQGNGKVDGDVLVTITGDGDNLSFADGAYLWGGCSGDYYVMNGDTRSVVSNVSGSRSLTFSGFEGDDFSANVAMFDTLAFTDGTSVRFTGENQDWREVSFWNLACGSVAELGSGLNDFTGDTLHVDLAGWDSDEGIMLLGADNALPDISVLQSVTLGSENAYWHEEKNAWRSIDYELGLSADGKNLMLSRSSLA